MPTYRTVQEYYRRRESMVGYMKVLGGTKHFGFYRPGDKQWRFAAAMRRMEAELLATLDQPAGARVLDAGCGMGDVAAYVARHGSLQVVGVDLLDFNLAEARRRTARRGLEGQISYQLADYAQTGLPDRSFDAIYTMETLVHAPQAEAALAEFWRLLRPGGRLVLFEYARADTRRSDPAAEASINRVNQLAAMPSFDRFYDGVLEELLGQAGFREVTTRDITAHIWPMLQAFRTMAVVPYTILRAIGKAHKVPNAMSAVEFWRYRRYIRYIAYSAIKP